MANSVQCILEVSNLNSTVVNDFIKKVEKNYAFYSKKISDLKLEYITSYVDLEEIQLVSEQSDSKLIFTYYDTAMGYARKKVYNRGYLTSDKSIFFPMDLEIEICEKSKINNTAFDKELDLYIEEHGEEESNFPRIGGFIEINEITCSDIDLLDWLKEQKENKFRVNNIEIESNGVWIDGCDYRIDLQECNTVA